MVDKRIRKTKKNLKATLIEMMNEIPFEEIAITDLCKQADISRITFYSHYNDKYALIDDIFQDMSHIGSDIYRQLQIENNPGHDHVQSYCNIRHSLQSLYHTYYDFFCHTNPDKNPYLAFTFYNYLLKTVETYTHQKELQSLNFKYSARKITGFLYYGMAGFINESHSENTPSEIIQQEADQLLKALLTSDVLIQY